MLTIWSCRSACFCLLIKDKLNDCHFAFVFLSVLLALKAWLHRQYGVYICLSDTAIVIFRSELHMFLGLYLLMDLLQRRVSIVYVILATIIAGIVLLGRSTSGLRRCLSASVCVFLSVFVFLSVCVTLCVCNSLPPLLLSLAVMLAFCYGLCSLSPPPLPLQTGLFLCLSVSLSWSVSCSLLPPHPLLPLSEQFYIIP